MSESAGTKAGIKRQRQRERATLEQRKADILSVLSTKQGRRFVWRLLQDGGIFRLSFVAGQVDVTAFHEGERNQALRLFVDATKWAPDLYLKMAREAAEDAARLELETKEPADETLNADEDE